MTRLKPKFRRAFAAGLMAISISGLSAVARATPSVSSVVIEQVSEKALEVTVQGSGFTTKADSAPVLYDHVDVTWENGKENRYQSTFNDGQLVQRVDLDPNTIWAKPSNPTEGNTGMLVVKTRPHRTPDGVAHYFGRGSDNFLGWPMASGGETTSYNSRVMFSSFWIKLPYDMARYYAVPGSQQSASFNDGGDEAYGEAIKISGIEGTGRVVRYKPDLGNQEFGWLFFEPPKGVSTRDMLGRELVGEESGASVVFPSTGSQSKFDDYGYLAPRGKYARFWSESSGKGYGFALGNIGWAGHGLSLWSNEYGSISPVPGEWNLVEVELSLGSTDGTIPPKLSVYINGKTFVKSNDNWEIGIQSVEVSNPAGLTIALLGVNDFMSVPFTVEVDDVYLDKSLHRVLLCNVSEFRLYREGNGHCEVQRITSWSDQNLTFQYYLGALSPNETAYLYVFDKNGNSNQLGVLVGSEKVPPSAIESFEIK